jgi:hypothetical protein
MGIGSLQCMHAGRFLPHKATVMKVNRIKKNMMWNNLKD